MKKFLSIIAIILTTAIYADYELETQNCAYDENLDCFWDIYELNATLSHIEGRGIGYKRGYTTLEAFYMPTWFNEDFMYTFIDLRGHGMNNGKLAANGGIGGALPLRFRLDTWCKYLLRLSPGNPPRF